ncbi:MAG: hypothetical protein GY820_14900 [Gammaproteobacteria bacterium]|nr:hypothetical protein [Gammaproteobacteria bacterium]
MNPKLNLVSLDFSGARTTPPPPLTSEWASSMSISITVHKCYAAVSPYSIPV